MRILGGRALTRVHRDAGGIILFVLNDSRQHTAWSGLDEVLDAVFSSLDEECSEVERLDQLGGEQFCEICAVSLIQRLTRDTR